MNTAVSRDYVLAGSVIREMKDDRNYGADVYKRRLGSECKKNVPYK